MANLRDRLNSALGDRYTVESEVGRGGMATVFLARDVKHDRQVALKVLHPDLAKSVGSERFLREISILARLNHPNILGLIDSGEADGLLYYVMPFVEGDTLRRRLSLESQLPIEDAVQVTREVADALGYAHGLDIVHRDIKPANIMFVAGHAVVTDFGIAQAVTEAGADQLTQTGLSVGTPYYMSPEQATGAETVDARSDLYSLGCVLYEMVGGEPPYTGPSSQAILSRHSQADIPLVSIIRPQTPPHVQAVIEKALAKSPADRFRTAERMRDALSGEFPLAGAKRQRHGTRNWRKPVLAAAAVALVAAAAYVISQSWGPLGDETANEVSTIAILPFYQQGDLDSTTLTGSTVAEVVARQLESGRHRPARPFLVKQHVAAECDEFMDRRCGIGVATALGARHFVFGTVTRREQEDSVTVSATIVDMSGEDVFDAITLRGSVTDPFPVLERLSSQLWIQIADEGERAVELAGLSTDDPNAFAAFVEGEKFFDEWKLNPARRQYGKAVALDSTFALAWFRLAVLYEWHNWIDSVEYAGRRAFQYADRLADPDRRMLEAFLPLARGDYQASETQLRALLEENPDDVILNYELALLLWGYHWRNARPIGISIEHFRRVLRLDPRNRSAATYLMWALAAEGDYEAMDSLATALWENNIWRHGIRLIRGQLRPDSAAFAAGLDSLGWLGATLYWAGTHHVDVPDPEVQSRAVHEFLEESRLEADSGSMDHLIADQLALSVSEAERGRFEAARDALEAADTLLVSVAPPEMVLLATLPLPGRSSFDTVGLASRIEEWTMGDIEFGDNGVFNVTWTAKYYEPYIRPYALGLLASAAGDFDVARRYADEVDSMEGPFHFPTVPQDVAQWLRADILLREGDPRAAIQAIDAAKGHLNYQEAWLAPIVSAMRPGYLRAMALQQLGEFDDALLWFEYGLGPVLNAGLTAVLLAPSHFHRGEIHEEQGNIDQAIWHYDAFAELWKDADPELQVKVREVLQHVAKLRGEVVDVTGD